MYVISSISPDRTLFWHVTEGPSVPTYEPLGNSTVYEFWCWYLKKRFVHISAQRAPYSGTMPGHQGWTLLMPLENYPTHYQNEHFWMVTLRFVLSYVHINPFGFVNPLSHKIHIQIVQTNLHTFLLRTVERVLDQSIVPLVINLVILIACTLVDLLMLLGENWCWSFLGGFTYPQLRLFAM